ncbi:MAG: hypothetical protein ACRD3S_16060 [Terracidiphilus sp.]
MPARFSQALKTIGKDQKSTRREPAHAGRFGPRAKAGNCKKSGKKSFDEQCLCTHDSSFETLRLWPEKPGPLLKLPCYGSVIPVGDMKDLQRVLHAHQRVQFRITLELLSD